MANRTPLSEDKKEEMRAKRRDTYHANVLAGKCKILTPEQKIKRSKAAYRRAVKDMSPQEIVEFEKRRERARRKIDKYRPYFNDNMNSILNGEWRI